MSRQELVQKARELSREIRKSDEYQEYFLAKNAAYQDPTTRVLVAKYHRLQLQVQGQRMFSGKEDDASMQELQKLGELLQFDNAASRLLIAEYTLRSMMAEVYTALGAELDMDEPSFEEEEAHETTEEEGEAQKEEEQGND